MAHIQIQLDSDDLRNPDRMQKLAAMFQALTPQCLAASDVTEGRILVPKPEMAIAYSTPISPDDNPEKGIPPATEAFRDSQTAETLPSPAQAFAPLAQAPQLGAQPSTPATTITAPLGAAVPSPASPTPPIPVPPPAAAPATAGSTSPAPAGIELDTEGLPWDVRIHSSSKEKIANGSWKLKRGVAQQEVWLNQIKDELRRALGNAPAAPAAPQPAAWPFPAPGATTSPTPLPPATAAPAASDPGTITMAQLLPRFTAAMSSNPPMLTPDVACAICTELSGGAVTNVAMLAVRPDLVPLVWERLDQLGVPK